MFAKEKTATERQKVLFRYVAAVLAAVAIALVAFCFLGSKENVLDELKKENEILPKFIEDPAQLQKIEEAMKNLSFFNGWKIQNVTEGFDVNFFKHLTIMETVAIIPSYCSTIFAIAEPFPGNKDKFLLYFRSAEFPLPAFLRNCPYMDIVKDGETKTLRCFKKEEIISKLKDQENLKELVENFLSYYFNQEIKCQSFHASPTENFYNLIWNLFCLNELQKQKFDWPKNALIFTKKDRAINFDVSYEQRNDNNVIKIHCSYERQEGWFWKKNKREINFTISLVF